VIWLLAYIATIFAANWLVVHVGIVPVGFGLVAPAGVYVVGIGFTLRDLVHRQLGRWWVLGAIIIGAALSALVSSRFAIASGATFLVAELADMAVYEPLHRRNWLAAVLVSNTVGLVVDSAMFLLLAFGSLQYLAGQVVGKGWMTALAVLAIWSWRALSLRRRSVAAV